VVDSPQANRIIGAAMVRSLTALACSLLLNASAFALVGGASTGGDGARHAVLLTGGRGNFCSGAVLTRDLVLTAAHCVPPNFDYKLIEYDSLRQPTLRDVAHVVRHPQFDREAARNHRVTADLALVKLAEPLPAAYVPVAVGARPTIAVGDKFIVTGYGVATRGDGRSGGIARSATLVATGQPGTLQLRLVDPATKGERPGLGACTGDSGAPVFETRGGRLAVIGVVSWSTGPGSSEGCGGLTGVTPIARYRDWVVETAGKMGSQLP
jgi:secreted trypsin-like serine protease